MRSQSSLERVRKKPGGKTNHPKIQRRQFTTIHHRRNKKQNRLRKTWQRTRNPQDAQLLKQAQPNIQKQIKRYQKDAWTDTLRAVSRHDDSLWRLTRRLKNNKTNIPSLQTNTPQTDEQKANTLATQFARVSSGSPDVTILQNEVTEQVKNFTKTKYPIPPPILNKILTTPKQLKKLITKLPNNKAPGVDQLPNILIKNLPKKATVQLTHIINKIMLLQHFPQQWKHAIVVPIPKPSKNPTDPSSYRPISLLSSLSKLVERAILNKLRLLGLESKVPEENPRCWWPWTCKRPLTASGLAG